jgi:uncharacterized protein YbjT (DUF2867 family)
MKMENSEKRTAIISGATGLVGEQLLNQLLSDAVYRKVIAIVRKPMDLVHEKLEQKVIDFGQLPETITGLKADDGYCCLGTTIKAAGSKERQYVIDHDYVVEFAKGCHQTGVTRFAVVSSIGANADSANFYLRTKGEMECDLKKIPFKAIFILQPSMLLGGRKEFRAGEKAAIALMHVMNPLMIGGLKRYRGVQASDVARCMISHIISAENGVKIIYPSLQSDPIPIKMKTAFFLFFFLMPALYTAAQQYKPVEDYVRISARADDPLYTTYAAAMARSQLYGDKAYKMDYFSDCQPVSYSSDHAGKMFCIWKVDEVVIPRIGEYLVKPVVRFSFPDMTILEYQPFRGIVVKETFFVYSSSIAMVDMEIKNTDKITHEVAAYPVLEMGNDSLEIVKFDRAADGYVTNRYERPYRLISSLKVEYGYPTKVRDFFASNRASASHGGYSGDMNDFYNVIKTDFYSDKRVDTLNMKSSGFVDFISLHLKKRLKPGESVNFRYLRGFQDQKEDAAKLIRTIDSVKHFMLKTYFEDNLILYSKIPRILFSNQQEKLAYLSAFNLARSCMYPPSGKTKYNFYAFSRNPLWGWGHGHQVLHESLSMLAYAYLDPKSAEGSQRVYMEQQREDGLIAYRHGPRGMQDYPHDNMSTTSAPFFNWINLELYQAGKDKQFLSDAYASGSRYVDWLIKNRDTDQDGTFEWGPYGIIENVRDWYNAVFQVSAERYLDVDKEDISDELECLDLTLMVIKEERSLGKMASILGKTAEAKKWKDLAEKSSKLVNERMWDDSSGFYYSVNKKDHAFQFMTRDLRRQEIIGFLALWAEVPSKERAARLIETLTDTTKFWRKYGVPTLSAKDPWYSPHVDYCCKWNGPVWLLWDYMVYDGLRIYGYDEIASQLAGKMVSAVTVQLSKNHNYWESYSPDNEVLNCPPNYIWDAIIAKLLIDENQK